MAASAGAWYRVGTVNVTNGSAAIVGAGSNWQNDVIAIAIGDAFTIDAKTWYEVIAVNSDTSITLDRGFEGSTDNGVEYAILRNTSGTILTRIAGQIAVQFNQKQLFLYLLAPVGLPAGSGFLKFFALFCGSKLSHDFCWIV